MTIESETQTNVIRCILRDPENRVVADASGRGVGWAAKASAMFEAWENYCHRSGFDEFRNDAERMRSIPGKEISNQPLLGRDSLVHRMADEFPDTRIACIRFDSIGGKSEPIWYPAFARFPWFVQYPVPGDDIGYHPYLRYSTNFGTAAGMSESEAILHALLEVVEGDAFSLALLGWTFDANPIAWTINPDDLPGDLQQLCTQFEGVAGCEPVICEITTDIGIPAYCALPVRSPHLVTGGAGAATTPGYAVERALGEMLQTHVTLTARPERDAQLRRKLTRLKAWPALESCMTLDGARLAGIAQHMPRRPTGWWDPAPITVEAQFRSVTQALESAGMPGYYVRWNAADSAVPVVTVLVPGLETFFLSRVGVPMLPTGRGVHKLPTRTGE
ncbi:YcaO-like family protein [Nocardia sp. NPDC127579]|uniref:YcaO-like family protein n=1 Tax=Nocardia sp. NPDC127579 TaxID=3345402 RepID=UPI003640D7A5